MIIAQKKGAGPDYSGPAPFFVKSRTEAINFRPAFGAAGRTRTDTVSLPLDFESSASANFTTAAYAWRPHRESNPELALRRGLLYPFNYGDILTNISYNIITKKARNFSSVRKICNKKTLLPL